MRKSAVLTLLIAMVGSAWADRPKPDPKLVNVTSIFVTGNNQAAEAARNELQKGKTCLSLADKASDADAVLDMNADSQSSGGSLGRMGSREWIASATLTLKDGSLVWSHSERWGDQPFTSGGKTAGKILVGRLAFECGCKERGKK